jgi:type II secretory pathway pseudopilin PulG
MRFHSKHSPVLLGKKRQGVLPGQAGRGRRGAGFTLAEVLISVVIVALVFGTIINGYLSAATRAQWTGYSLAAQSLAGQCVEQARSGVWDGSANGRNELTNIILLSSSYNSTSKTFTGYTTNIMDIPWKGTNYMIATNFITIQRFYENNNSNVQVELQMVRVDTVWPFNGWGKLGLAYYTNSICTYIAPDNR